MIFVCFFCFLSVYQTMLWPNLIKIINSFVIVVLVVAIVVVVCIIAIVIMFINTSTRGLVSGNATNSQVVLVLK